MRSTASSQIQQYAMQPWLPSTYTGPEDEDELLTVWLAYIPSDQVNNLAEQIKVTSSAFYTKLAPPYSTLAEQVDPSFSVDSVAPPSGDSGGPSSGGSGSSSNAASGKSSGLSNTRRDAIIGVVSSLGAVALIVLAFLSMRAIKRRRELAHQRLQEPAAADMYDGSRPDGRDFDQDSVGGQRRRSFYFAADSLRGFSEVANTAAQFDQRLSPDSGMRERRGVAGAISTPILRENTMNW